MRRVQFIVRVDASIYPLYYVISVGKLLQFVPAVCTVNDVCIIRT